VLCISVTPLLAQQEWGGGYSIFMPMGIFQGQTSSVAVETSFGTSLGLFGDFLTLPISAAYTQTYGMTVTGKLNGKNFKSDAAWFYADNVRLHLLLNVRIPINWVYFDLFGGGIGNWNISLRPFNDRITSDLQEEGILDKNAHVALSSVDIESGLGVGYTIGAGFGMNFGSFNAGLDASYMYVVHPLRLRGTGYTGANQSTSFDLKELVVLLEGITFGINASVSL
jgi:hypothetical protein